MPRIIITLSVKDVEYVAHRLAKKTMDFDEPIPKFNTRYPGRLESCLALPVQSFSNKHLYRGVTRRAAVMFYLMIKNHPFQNRNKRIAMTSLLVLLHRYDKWLKVDTQELYNFAVWVASSPSKLKDDVINAIEKFIGHVIVKLTK